MGLPETIQLILNNSNYSPEIRASLLKNIFINVLFFFPEKNKQGGGAFTKNLSERLKKELESMMPFGSEIQIKIV